MQPYLRYPGAKWGLASWIVQYFPPRYRCYVELYCGSAACFFSLRTLPQQVVLNDLSGEVVNLFRVLREQGDELIAAIEMTPWARAEYDLSSGSPQPPDEDRVERARRFLVRCWQAHGARLSSSSGWSRGGRTKSSGLSQWHALPERLAAVITRLKRAEIECRPALSLLCDPNYWYPDVLFYVDPPYMLPTRHDRYYQYEMTDDEHQALLEALDTHPGYVVLSGYAHPLYDERLAHWGRVSRQAYAESGQAKTEVLWLSPRTMRALAAWQLRLFDEMPSGDGAEKQEKQPGGWWPGDTLRGPGGDAL